MIHTVRTRLVIEPLEDRLAPATFTVTTADDVGPGSLRRAIHLANASPGLDMIAFAIPGDGVHTINVQTALPAITDPVAVGGQTQPGYQGRPLIELNGTNAGIGVQGLVIERGGSGSVIRALAINRFAMPGPLFEERGADGIRILADNCVVKGCFIGTDPTGTIDLSNAGAGVRILGGASNNLVGGTTAPARNIISGNTHAGVHIGGAGTNGNRIQGNFIGTDATGLAALGNGGEFEGGWGGVVVVRDAAQTLIGGTAPGAGNVIAANWGGGVGAGGAGRNVVQGNFIGTDKTGLAPLGNNGTGVGVSGDRNLVGGTVPAARNVIAANTGSGVHIAGEVGGIGDPDDLAIGNVVQGNFIGTDKTGLAALGNGLGGVEVFGTKSTLIGGTTPGAGNVIAGSLGAFDGYGLRIGFSSDTRVQGNFIGTDRTGLAPLGNALSGVNLSSGPGGNNVIGGTTPGARNVISGNRTGIEVTSRNDRIQGNYIGTDVTGTQDLGNAEAGISLHSQASGIVIGGTVPGARNVISGNDADGVWIAENSNSNLVLGNFIGTDASGTLPLGNARHGVRVTDSSENVVGGSVPGARNIISGNGGSGVVIEGRRGNKVRGNFIGTDVTGARDLGNARHGVFVTRGAFQSRIGGKASGTGNVIVHNGGAGVLIGSDPDAGYLTPAGDQNAVYRNRIYDNGGLGIDLGPNDGVTPNDLNDPDNSADREDNRLFNFPVLESAALSPLGLRVTGRLNTESEMTVRIEFFVSPSKDESDHGEGRRFLGATTVITGPGENTVEFAKLLPAVSPGRFLTATATDALGNTSEFSEAQTVDTVP
jgi:titin